MFDNNFYLRCINKSYAEFNDIYELAIKYLNDNDVKFNFIYKTTILIHWLLDVIDKKQIISLVQGNEQEFLRGLRHANNKLKHDSIIHNVTQRTGGFSFPITFPLSVEIVTFKFINLPFDPNHPDNSNAYNNHRALTDVRETLTLIKTIVERFLETN